MRVWPVTLKAPVDAGAAQERRCPVGGFPSSLDRNVFHFISFTVIFFFRYACLLVRSFVCLFDRFPSLQKLTMRGGVAL